MDKMTLQRRYRYLWTGEATAAIFFIALFFWSAYQDGVWQRWIVRSYSLTVVVLILVQGMIWWRRKLRLLRENQRQMPAPVLNVYRFWRHINWWLIGGFPIVVVLTAVLTNQPFLSADTAYGLLILLGAILEQINYYYVQLMYDSAYYWNHLRTHRRLRRGTIGKALDEPSG